MSNTAAFETAGMGTPSTQDRLLIVTNMMNTLVIERTRVPDMEYLMALIALKLEGHDVRFSSGRPQSFAEPFRGRPSFNETFATFYLPRAIMELQKRPDAIGETARAHPDVIRAMFLKDDAADFIEHEDVIADECRHTGRRVDLYLDDYPGNSVAEVSKMIYRVPKQGTGMQDRAVFNIFVQAILERPSQDVRTLVPVMGQAHPASTREAAPE